MKLKILKTLLVILLLMNLSYLRPEVIEKIEVKGKIYSKVMNSKNMIILTGSDLQKMGIKEVSKLFLMLPGVSISRRGPMDTSFDISMRGSNFEQLLLLINGIPYNNPQTGHFNTDFPFSVKDIERVEIVRGGTSVSSGESGFAGVLNIILKKSDKIDFSTEIGEKNLFGSNLSLGHSSGNIAFRVSVKRNNSLGYYKGREFDKFNILGNGTYSREGMNINFATGYLFKNFGADGFYAPFPSREEIDSYFINWNLKKKHRNVIYRINYSYNHHKDCFILDRYSPDYFKSNTKTGQHYLNLGSNLRSEKTEIFGGIDFNFSKMESSSMGNKIRDKGAVYLNLNFSDENWGIDSGFRVITQFRNRAYFTFYSGIYGNFNQSAVFKLGVGKSIRFPSFTELYYNSPANRGDSNLLVETSYNFESSISYFKGNYNIDLSFFFRKQNNMIDWVKYDSLNYWCAKNIERNDIFGFEINQNFSLKNFLITASVERLFVIKKEDEFLSKYGFRFPDFLVKLSCNYIFSKYFDISANYNYKHLFEGDESGHFLDLTFSLKVKKAGFSIHMNNLFNTIIEEIPGVKIPGRWFYVSLFYKK